MKLLNYNIENADISLSNDELLTIYNSLNEVCNGMHIYEFETRIGVSKEEAYNLMKIIRKLIENMDQLVPGEALKIATELEDKLLLCPNCADFWESTSMDSIVTCPHCNKACFNPRSRNAALLKKSDTEKN